MDKNVYSVVLLDEVVDAVDRLACKRSTSRSGLINQILADYLSCPTPEKRIRGIFSCMEKGFAGLDDFQFRDPPCGSVITVRSALHYRYRPTVRYTLELYRRCEPSIGELRVSMRTQSEPLLALSGAFFRFWSGMEDEWIGTCFPEDGIPCETEPARFSRRLQCPCEKENCTNEKIAEAILAYLREFDFQMKAYFAGAGNLDETERQLENQYGNYLKNAVIL